MSEKAENTNRGMIATLVVVAIAAVAIIIFAVTQLGGTGDDDAPTGTETSAPADDEGADDNSEDDGDGAEDSDDVQTGKTTYLPEKMSGQEAIDALGDDLATVAKLNNKTPEEFEEFLLDNPSAKVMPNGTILIP